MTCCNGKKSGWLFVLVLVLLGAWVARVHHHRRVARATSPAPMIGFAADVSPAPPFTPPPEVPAPARVSPAVGPPVRASSLGHWPPEPGDGFDADVELSQRAAFQSAARQIARVAGVTCTDLGNVTDISVYIDGGGAERMDDVVQAFRPVVPGVMPTHVAGRPAVLRAADDHLWVTFRTINSAPSHVPWSISLPARGSIEAAVIGPAGTRRVQVRFDEKAWAEDLSAFAATDRARRWIVGQSGRPCATPYEAERAARADAARQLASLAQTRLPVGQPTAERAEAALAGGRFVADRLTRRFHRDYGDVWYDAVLVDASPGNLQALADEANHITRARRASFIARAASGAAMVAVIFLIYVVVNTFTKGYFVWRLRAATALLLVFAVGALLLLAVMG